MSMQSFFATLAAGTVAVVGVGLYFQKRKSIRLPANEYGLPDANLSIEERRRAAAEMAKSRRDQTAS